MDTCGSWLAVCECALGIVAAGASDSAIGGQTTVEEKFLAESDFLRRLQIVQWYDHPRLVDRKTHLLGRSRLGQWARLGNRRLNSGFRRCVSRTRVYKDHQDD